MLSVCSGRISLFQDGVVLSVAFEEKCLVGLRDSKGNGAQRISRSMAGMKKRTREHFRVAMSRCIYIYIYMEMTPGERTVAPPPLSLSHTLCAAIVGNTSQFT